MMLYVMSHLSDAQDMLEFHRGNSKTNRQINFAKFLMGKCDGDLNKEYSPMEIDEFWKEFNKKI